MVKLPKQRPDKDCGFLQR